MREIYFGATVFCFVVAVSSFLLHILSRCRYVYVRIRTIMGAPLFGKSEKSDKIWKFLIRVGEFSENEKLLKNRLSDACTFFVVTVGVLKKENKNSYEKSGKVRKNRSRKKKVATQYELASQLWDTAFVMEWNVTLIPA